MYPDIRSMCHYVLGNLSYLISLQTRASNNMILMEFNEYSKRVSLRKYLLCISVSKVYLPKIVTQLLIYVHLLAFLLYLLRLLYLLAFLIIDISSFLHK